jgi:hypothetical protein
LEIEPDDGEGFCVAEAMSRVYSCLRTSISSVLGYLRSGETQDELDGELRERMRVFVEDGGISEVATEEETAPGDAPEEEEDHVESPSPARSVPDDPGFHALHRMSSAFALPEDDGDRFDPAFYLLDEEEDLLEPVSEGDEPICSPLGTLSPGSPRRSRLCLPLTPDLDADPSPEYHLSPPRRYGLKGGSRLDPDLEAQAASDPEQEQRTSDLQSGLQTEPEWASEPEDEVLTYPEHFLTRHEPRRQRREQSRRFRMKWFDRSLA